MHSEAKPLYFDQCGGSNPAAERALRNLTRALGVASPELHVCWFGVSL